MGSAFGSVYIHYVFSTKHRLPLITGEFRYRLFPFIGGILFRNRSNMLAIGGIADHLHILASLPTTFSISHVMQLVKGGSSRWAHDAFPELAGFAWQDGYGAFSVSHSGLKKTVQYVMNQEKHHANMSFEAEFQLLVEKNSAGTKTVLQ